MAFDREKIIKENRQNVVSDFKQELIKGGEEVVRVATLSLGDVVDVEIEKLKSFSEHTYKIMEDKVEDYKESIEKFGLFTPIIIWDKNDGSYEILAGHHRVEACKKLGKKIIPAVIKKDIDINEAKIIANQTNMLQRSFKELSLYEQANSLYQMQEARKNFEKKLDINTNINDEQVSDCEEATSETSGSGIRGIAREFGISKTTVARYLNLFKSFNKSWFLYMENNEDKKAMFDTNVGETFCALPKNILEKLFNFVSISPVKKISINQAKQLIEIYKKTNDLTDSDFNKVLIYSEIENKFRKPITIKRDMFNEYFPDGTSDEQIINELLNLLKEHRGKNES